MGTLTKEQVLSRKPQVAKVSLPGDAHVYIRSMTGNQRDTLEARFSNGTKGYAGVRAQIGVWCICDESGTRMFADSDLAALGELDAEFLDAVFTKATDMSGLRDGAVKELAGNSPAAQSD